MGHIAVCIYIYILCNMPETLSKEYCIHSRTFFTGKDFSKYCCIYWSLLLRSNVTFSQRNTKNHSPEVSVSQCISFWSIRKGPYIYIYTHVCIYLYIYIYISCICHIYMSYKQPAGWRLLLGVLLCHGVPQKSKISHISGRSHGANWLQLATSYTYLVKNQNLYIFNSWSELVNKLISSHL